MLEEQALRMSTWSRSLNKDWVNEQQHRMNVRDARTRHLYVRQRKGRFDVHVKGQMLILFFGTDWRHLLNR